MRLLTYNILDAGTGRVDPLAEVIRLANPDIVILQETTDDALFHRLADRLHMDRFRAPHALSPRLAGGNPSQESATGLLTRWHIREAINHAPLDPRITRSMLTALIRDPAGAEWPILGLHLHAKESHADETIRLTEIPALLDIARTLPAAHILAGDFNSTHPEQRIDFQKLRPKTKERIAAQNNEIPREAIRRILGSGYIDAHALHHTPEQFHTTLTTAHPALRVDYVFVTQPLAPRVKSCEAFKPEIGRFASDHFPLLAVIE